MSFLELSQRMYDQGAGGGNPPADPPSDPPTDPPADPPPDKPDGDPTPEKGEQSIDLSSLQKQLDGISTLARKDGKVDTALLEKVDASINRLADSLKPPEAPDESERIAALEKKVSDGENALKVQEIKTTYGLSDSDVELIGDPDLELFEKRAKVQADRNKLQTRRQSVGKIPADLEGNETAERLTRQMSG